MVTMQRQALTDGARTLVDLAAQFHCHRRPMRVSRSSPIGVAGT